MRALLIIDMQNDFMPEGPLGVPHADRLIPVIQKLMKMFSLCVATQDWHPGNHESFSIWPVHCVQNTHGAEIVSGIDVNTVFRKGSDVKVDSYSGFFDNERKHNTGLEKYLRERGVDEVYLVGVATDYCVGYSALDALSLGFKTYIVTDGCAGISQDSTEKMLDEIVKKGGKCLMSKQIH